MHRVGLAIIGIGLAAALLVGIVAAILQCRLPQRTSPGSWLACITQSASWASSSSSSSWMSR